MKKILFLMLSIAAMLTSCSQNDEVLSDSSEAQEVKFSLATDPAQSRADGLRYVMAIYDENGENAVIAETVYDSSTFSVRLEPGKYTCLFWADYGEANYDAKSLKNIALQANTTNAEAFFAKKVINVTDNGEESITLHRAVAQVTLKETDYLDPGTMTVSFTEFQGFDVNSGKAVNEVAVTKTINIAETVQATPAAPVELASYLMLANPAERDLRDFTVQYASEPEKTITNVPVQANYKTYIIGKYGLTVSQTFAITVDENWAEDENEVSLEIPYITFSAERKQIFTMSFSNFQLGTGEYFEYSVGDGDWTRFTSTVENISFGGTLGDLRLRGISSKGTAQYAYDKYCVISFGVDVVPVECKGDIRTLVDYENHQTANTENARFCNLFEFNKNLRTAPDLPAATLATNCYDRMFASCTSLIEAPELPAETLADYCYLDMFTYCSSLTTAPKINAKTLAEGCCRYMFWKCTSLTKAPELPVAKLETLCYSYMFEGCTKLSEVTMLATDVSASNCLLDWLHNAGTDAGSRKLTLANEGIYNSLCANSDYLPENWKSGQAEIIYK